MRSIPVLIINLKKDIQKRHYMKSLCHKFAFQAEFIEAVNGSLLNQEEMSEIYSGMLATKEIGRELSRGEIGCALSHKKIYEKIVHENIDIALVLEDDIDFNEELLTLMDMQDKFQKNWELVLLGHHTGYSRDKDTSASIWGQIKLTEKYAIVRPCEEAYGTYGYLLTKKGAQKLLDHLDMINKPIDHYTGDSRYIHLYTINPAPIKIYEHLSEEHNSMQERQILGDAQPLKTSKDRVRFFLEKVNLLNLLFTVRSFFMKFKILKRY